MCNLGLHPPEAVFQTLGMMKEETLAVPLFIFMGHVLEQAGLMEPLFRSFQFIPTAACSTS